MYYQFISFLFWQQYRRAKFPSIVNCSSWDKTFDFRIISNLILSYNITFLFLCCSRGCFVNQQWSAVFFIVFQGSGNTSWQWDLGAIRKSLGFSLRYTGVLLPDSHPLPTHAKTLYWQSILLNMLTIIKLLLFVGGHSSWVAKIFLVHKEVIVLVANLG